MIQPQIFTLLSLFTIVFAVVEIDIFNIPPSDDAACMARYIVHNSDWCSLSYISENDKLTRDAPLSRIYSISDGIAHGSTGTIYLMVSPLDLTIQDLFKNNKCSVIMSLAQTHYCYIKRYDVQDPRCAQVILSGNFVVISNETNEFEFAKKAVWSRHPVMQYWYKMVTNHKWIFAKIIINQIAVVDFFGGRKFPPVFEYFNKNCTQYETFDVADFNIQVHPTTEIPTFILLTFVNYYIRSRTHQDNFFNSVL